ncbi:MAG: 4-(cytidine 5'-diphospho)-2-C-methyl-D-erythritol kinase [Deltaproteobacteria bacterium]|nr:MAG: 4-(cytidine 5'-diphospho)-2-C-methyl-D-erythritol kinase [Deltaproteobacteria bacterium]
MICFPNCKINLGLSITEKRNDGFHNLETIMYPLNLHDILEIIVAPDKQFEFNSTGINIPGDSANNIVVKAFELLQANHQLPPVKIHLHKIIPMGAGLGGGSSDAAFTIKLLNDLFNLRLSVSTMQDYAGRLGSDCPFFIKNKAVLASNTGDQFEPLNLNLKKFFFAIVAPKIHINTPEAYSWIKPKFKQTSLQTIISYPIDQWKQNLTNDFEIEVFKRFQEIEKIKENLYNAGAIYASMSGSGSAVYGIFNNPVSLTNKFSEYYYWPGMGS